MDDRKDFNKDKLGLIAIISLIFSGIFLKARASLVVSIISILVIIYTIYSNDSTKKSSKTILIIGFIILLILKMSLYLKS
ncbi:hypothetical protein [uncultured Anaerococcus sp.]|uniref:hypothetical protein n=1 Tax=uncultured Anaerococcus sp. TaxID=293428 RepID=UPI0026320EBC|nr:hypothetical protein [uncultured Anaerococcus sp.]